MDLSMISDFLSNNAFPIMACIAMAWYVKYITDKHAAELETKDERHKEELDKITEAINNNTLVMQKLCDRMDVDNNYDKE